MGTNTDAILFYGFHADEGAWDEFIGENDWEDKFVEVSGRPAPKAEFSDDTKGDYVSYWKMKKAFVDAEPCQVDFHCSGSAAMPYACVKASKTVAWRGNPIQISSLAVDPTWDEALQTFAKKMGIPWQEPRWWLVSYWGN